MRFFESYNEYGDSIYCFRTPAFSDILENYKDPSFCENVLKNNFKYRYSMKVLSSRRNSFGIYNIAYYNRNRKRPFRVMAKPKLPLNAIRYTKEQSRNTSMGKFMDDILSLY